MSSFEGVQITTLANGFTVITDHFPDNPRTAASIILASGGFHDPADKSGIGHLLEHMIAHGHPDQTNRDFAILVDRLAIPSELCTTKDKIMARTAGRTASVMDFMNFMGCAMSSMRYTPENLEAERGPIWEEMAEIHASPETRLGFEQWAAVLGEDSPATRHIGGDPEHLKDISYADLKAYEKQHLVGGNMLFVSSGGLSHADAVSFAETYFGSFEPGERQARFGGPLRLSDAFLPIPGYKGKTSQVTLRFDASDLMPMGESELEIVSLFLGRVLKHGLRFDNGSVYRSAAAFRCVNKDEATLEISTAFDLDGMDKVLEKIDEIFYKMRSGSLEFEEIFNGVLEKMTNAYAEYQLNVKTDLVMRREMLASEIMINGKKPNPEADMAAMMRLTYKDVLRMVTQSIARAPAVEYYGYVAETPLTGVQIGQRLGCRSPDTRGAAHMMGNRVAAKPQVA